MNRRIPERVKTQVGILSAAEIGHITELTLIRKSDGHQT